MQLAQLKKAYRYNTDTMLLAHFAQQRLSARHPSTKKRAYRLLDIGSGCGVLALMMARFLHSHLHQVNRVFATKLPESGNRLKNPYQNASLYQVDAIDIQPINLLLMRRNSFFNAFKITSILSDIKDFRPQYQYDALICNPPFYHKLGSANEHIARSRQAVFMPLDELFAASSKLMRPNAHMYLCYEASKLSEIISTAKSYKLHVSCIQIAYGNESKNANLLLMEFRRAQSVDLQILPSIICFQAQQPSEFLAQIYSQAKLSSMDISEKEVEDIAKHYQL